MTDWARGPGDHASRRRVGGGSDRRDRHDDARDDIGAVPIVSQDGKLVGILSESDFSGREIVFATSRYGHEIRLPKVVGELLTHADALEDLYERAQRLPARTVMSRPAHVATEDEPVQQALTRLLHHAIDHLPVVRAGVPVVMLARFDLIRLASQT